MCTTNWILFAFSPCGTTSTNHMICKLRGENLQNVYIFKMWVEVGIEPDTEIKCSIVLMDCCFSWQGSSE